MSPEPYVVEVSPLEEFAVLADAVRTGGVLGVVVSAWEPGREPPPHTLLRSDRVLLVTDGRCRVRVGAREHEVGAGAVLFVPRGTRFALTAYDGCRVTTVLAPAGPEAWLAAVAAPDVPFASVLEVAAEHGIVVHPR